MDILFCILAGGKSSRFKRDKRLAKLFGKPLIEIVYEELSKFSDNIVVSAKQGDNIDLLDAKLIEDSQSFAGPVCGMLDVMREIEASRYLFFAADMPFITDNMVGRLIETSACGKIALFKCHDKLMPLPIAIPRSVKNGKFDCKNKRILFLIENFEHVIIELESSECGHFFNINTQEDLIVAEDMSFE